MTANSIVFNQVFEEGSDTLVQPAEGVSVTISGYEEEGRFQAEKILVYLFI